MLRHPARFLTVVIRITMLSVITMMGCSSPREREDWKLSSESESFTVDEARAVFESGLTSTRGALCKGPFGGMEYTPEWERACFVRGRRSVQLYRVPILTNQVYSCVQGEYKEGLSRIKTERLHQCLVVAKDMGRGNACCYLETEIPTTGHIGAKVFSGIRLYTEISGGSIVGVCKYRRGVRIDGVFLPGDKQTRTLREAHARILLYGIRLFSGVRIETRSEEWGYEDQDYYDMGGGFYYDDSGYIYYDMDGDGIPDSLWIDPLEFDGGGDDPGWGGEDDPWTDPGAGTGGDEGGSGEDPNPEGMGEGDANGGQGGNTNGQVIGFQPLPGDVMARTIPDSLRVIPRQIPGGCALASVEYAYKLYGNYITESEIAQYCIEELHVFPYKTSDSDGGLTLTQLRQVVDYYFYTTDRLLTELIQGGDFAFALTLTSEGAHVVVVVGYNSITGQIIVMDPEIGYLTRKTIESNTSFTALIGVK